MALRNIRFDGDELLRKKSKQVTDITKSVEILVQDMLDTMKHHNGVGLAAPQVGILKRIVVIDEEEEEDEEEDKKGNNKKKDAKNGAANKNGNGNGGGEDKIYEMINPEIVDSDGVQTGDEACLSVPGLIGTVDRPEKVTVKFLDRKGMTQTLTAEGRLAIIVSHEIDHLDGVLYKDRAAPGTMRENTPDEENGKGGGKRVSMKKRRAKK